MYTMMGNLSCNEAALRRCELAAGVITEIKLNTKPFGARYDAE